MPRNLARETALKNLLPVHQQLYDVTESLTYESTTQTPDQLLEAANELCDAAAEVRRIATWWRAVQPAPSEPTASAPQPSPSPDGAPGH